MSEPRWTKGDWDAHKLPVDRWLIMAGEINVAGTAHIGFGPNDEEVEKANAHLIASAPNHDARLVESTRLLAELHAVASPDWKSTIEGQINANKAALAEARGESDG